MSDEDLKDICKILNRTNWRVLAWYFDKDTTRACGLKHFGYLGSMPMPSTGKEKFSTFVFFKTRKYVPGQEDEDSDSSSDPEQVQQKPHQRSPSRTHN